MAGRFGEGSGQGAVWTVPNPAEAIGVDHTLDSFQNVAGGRKGPIDLGTVHVSVPQGQVTQAGTEEPSTGKITFGAAVIFPAVLMSPVFLSNTIDGIESEGVANGQKLRETYDIFYGLFGIIAGILIVMVGYRYVALAGAVMGILGNLIAAASPRSLSTLSASIGFLNGLGNIFLMTSVTVAVLEYHKEKSLRVLLLGTALAFFLTIIFYIIDFLVSLPPGTDFSSAWRFVHGYHTFYYSALVIPGAACLAPLNLIMEGTRKETYVSRALSIKSGGLELLKSPVFYVLVGVFFCTGLGVHIPPVYLDDASSFSFFGLLIPSSFMTFGSFCVTAFSCCCMCCCCCRDADKAVPTIAVLGFIMGLLSLTVELFGTFYVLLYALVFGVCAGLRAPLMKYVIPRAMKATDNKNLGLLVGAAEFGAGIGVIIGEQIAESVAATGAFYFAGVVLTVSAGCAVVLHMKTKTGPSLVGYSSSGSAGVILSLPPQNNAGGTQTAGQTQTPQTTAGGREGAALSADAQTSTDNNGKSTAKPLMVDRGTDPDPPPPDFFLY